MQEHKITQLPSKHTLYIYVNLILRSTTLLTWSRLFLLPELILTQKHLPIIYFLWKLLWTHSQHITFRKLYQCNHSSKCQPLSNCHPNNKYFLVHAMHILIKFFLNSFSIAIHTCYNCWLFNQIELWDFFSCSWCQDEIFLIFLFHFKDFINLFRTMYTIFYSY